MGLIRKKLEAKYTYLVKKDDTARMILRVELERLADEEMDAEEASDCQTMKAGSDVANTC